MHIRLNRERKWDIEFRKQCHKKEMAQRSIQQHIPGRKWFKTASARTAVANRQLTWKYQS